MNVIDGDVNKDDKEYISGDDSTVKDIDFENNANKKNHDDCFKNYIDAKMINTIVNATQSFTTFTKELEVEGNSKQESTKQGYGA